MTPEQSAILRQHQTQIPVRVGQVAADLGIVVFEASLGHNISGLIQPHALAQSGFVIKVNRYDSPERKRFTIAHEIAHFLLHKDYILNGVIDNIMYRSTLGSKKETEANKFAAEMLMPMQQVRAQLELLDGCDLIEAAKRLALVFRVSVPAMKVRLGVGE